MKVSNMVSNKGNTIPNQFIIEGVEGRTWFQSYNSLIVQKNSDGSIKLDKVFWNYSKTTSKYRNKFLGETTKETKRKIKEGIYQLVNLN